MRETIRIFKALSDPTRLRTFRLLLERDLCVCELMYVLNMSQSRISHQLRLLRDADLVEDRRDGRWIINTVPPGVRKDLGPLVRRLVGRDPASPKAVLKDLERLDLCLRKNVRAKRVEPATRDKTRGAGKSLRAGALR